MITIEIGLTVSVSKDVVSLPDVLSSLRTNGIVFRSRIRNIVDLGVLSGSSDEFEHK